MAEVVSPPTEKPESLSIPATVIILRSLLFRKMEATALLLQTRHLLEVDQNGLREKLRGTPASALHAVHWGWQGQS